MVTILVIGDPHFKVDNATETELFVEAVTSLAVERNPDRIVILGDVLHTHEKLHVFPLNKAYDFIDTMRKIAKTYVLVGNHDLCNNRQFLSKNHWMRGMMEWDNITIIENVHSETIGNEKFVFVPYVEPGRFVEALNTMRDDWKDARCIFAHQEFAGCKMGAITSIEGDKWDLDNPHVVSGHIHSRQIIQDNIYYPGSAMQHAFGESDKNIIAFLTFQTGYEIGYEIGYEREEIDLNLPRKKIVYMDIDDIDSYVPPNTDDQIKVTLSGDPEDFKALKKTTKYKKLIESGTKVVFKMNKADRAKKDKVHAKNISTDSQDFGTILNDLVTEKANPFLYQSYQLVVNGKDIKVEDVIFV
jgi:DNA repair exonuclease SbcCD nuclease subunit